MTKVDLTKESKTKVDLTKESKSQNFTWDSIPGTWDEHTYSTWDSQRMTGSKESKTKDDLSLESK